MPPILVRQSKISPARSTAVALLLLPPTAITALAHPELVRSDGITPTTCATYATGGGVHALKLLTRSPAKTYTRGNVQCNSLLGR